MCQMPCPSSISNLSPESRSGEDVDEAEEDEDESAAAADDSSRCESRDFKRKVLVQDLARRLSGANLVVRIQAARELRKLARASPRSRSALAVAAIVQPLIDMLASRDHDAREASLLALLNLAVRNERFLDPRNKDMIVKVGAVPHLMDLLSSEKNSLKELATAAVLTLSASTTNKPIIITSGAVPLLVQVLTSGSIQGRVDAVTALYNLSSCKETSSFILPAEAVNPLLSLLKDCKRYSKFAEKATGLLEILSETEEGRSFISEFDGGILTLVETVEEGSLVSTEYAVGVLLSLCTSCREKYRELILKEGPIPGLLLLTAEGTKKAQDRARELLELLRDNIPAKRIASNELESIVYDIASRVDGPANAAATARRLMEDMERRKVELTDTKLQQQAASSTAKTP